MQTRTLNKQEPAKGQEVASEPSSEYVKLPEDEARERIALLCYFTEQYRTDYDPAEARRLGLGPSAYCYRNLDEKALAAFEASFSEPKPSEADRLRRLRNQRYYQRKKARDAESVLKCAPVP